jgi:hypothetical protein
MGASSRFVHTIKHSQLTAPEGFFPGKRAELPDALLLAGHSDGLWLGFAIYLQSEGS